MKKNVLKVIGDILYTIVFFVVLLILLVVILQRVSSNNQSLGGYRIFSVITESMLPKYEVGDILIVKEIEPSNIKVGDDITYKGEKDSFAGKVVTHQVISIEKKEDGAYKIITKGLANSEEDPEITDNQVYGKVIYKTKILGLIGRITQNIYVFYFIIFVPIALIIFKQIRNIIRDDDDDLDDDSENNAEDNKEDNK